MLWAKLEEVDSTYVLLEDKNAKNKLSLEIHHTEKGEINSLEDLHSLPYGELLIGFGSEFEFYFFNYHV